MSNSVRRLRQEAATIREAAATLSMDSDRELFLAHARGLEVEAASLEAQAARLALRGHRTHDGVVDLPTGLVRDGSDNAFRIVQRCVLCGKPKNHHRAFSLDCPQGKRTPVGYTTFGPDRFLVRNGDPEFERPADLASRSGVRG